MFPAMFLVHTKYRCPSTWPETGREKQAAGPGANLVHGHRRLWDEVTQGMAPRVHLAATNRVRVTNLCIHPCTEAAKAGS